MAVNSESTQTEDSSLYTSVYMHYLVSRIYIILYIYIYKYEIKYL